MIEELEEYLETDDVIKLQEMTAKGIQVDYKFQAVTEKQPVILKSNPCLLSFACFYKAESCVRFLIQNGAVVTIPDSEGFSNRYPIHFAAAGGQVSIILILNEIGAEYTVRDHQAFTSIHYAALFGNYRALQLLWTYGAASLDDKAHTLLVQSGITPLHLGAQNGSFEIINFLLENGGKINGTTSDGLTPLHFAIKGGKLDVVKYLIEKGADYTKTNIYGVFCYYYIIYSRIYHIKKKNL